MTHEHATSFAWALWALWFFCLEIPAVMNEHRGDTLSEKLWALASVHEKGRGWRWRRMTLLVALAWLVTHLLTGGWV